MGYFFYPASGSGSTNPTKAGSGSAGQETFEDMKNVKDGTERAINNKG